MAVYVLMILPSLVDVRIESTVSSSSLAASEVALIFSESPFSLSFPFSSGRERSFDHSRFIDGFKPSVLGANLPTIARVSGVVEVTVAGASSLFEESEPQDQLSGRATVEATRISSRNALGFIFILSAWSYLIGDKRQGSVDVRATWEKEKAAAKESENRLSPIFDWRPEKETRTRVSVQE